MSIFNEIEKFGVVPVIAIDDAKDALPLADALAEGGLKIAEITFRTDAAAQAIENIAQHRPEILVGAGTVLNSDQLKTAAKAGAQFALSPGFDKDLVQEAIADKVAFVPGIMTPSDLIAGIGLGCTMFKFFPAGAAGGPNMLKSIAAPFMHLGIGFNPTGGISVKSLGDWLSLAGVRAVGGTWIAPQRDIAEGNWSQITQNAREAVDAVASIRG